MRGQRHEEFCKEVSGRGRGGMQSKGAGEANKGQGSSVHCVPPRARNIFKDEEGKHSVNKRMILGIHREVRSLRF